MVYSRLGYYPDPLEKIVYGIPTIKEFYEKYYAYEYAGLIINNKLIGYLHFDNNGVSYAPHVIEYKNLYGKRKYWTCQELDSICADSDHLRPEEKLLKWTATRG